MPDLFNPTDEHAALRRMVRDFSEREVDPQAAEHDRAERFNLPLFRRLGELGLLGITVPAEYGGAGMDATAAIIACEELGSADPGFTLSYLAHAILFANNLARNGSPEQCARILPAVCRGEKIGGMCLSEPAAGTDVLGMQTTVRRDGDHYVLRGTKMWITNGALTDGETGDVFLVYARLEGGGKRDISQLVVEKGTPGFSLGQKLHDKLGMRASTTAELVFDECRVPAANLAEFVGGLALIIGLLARPAAAVLAVTMLVAIVTVHMANGFFMSNNGYEFALALLVISLAVLVEGAGKLSLDKQIAG
jgi:isovaleryl-CoA dehydrogenase